MKNLSLYDDCLRDQLRQYTREIVELIATRLQMETDMIFSVVKHSSEPHKTKKQKKIMLIENEDDRVQNTLEYINLDKGDFLYDPNSQKVYSFTKVPKLIGILDISTGAIMCM